MEESTMSAYILVKKRADANTVLHTYLERE